MYIYIYIRINVQGNSIFDLFAGHLFWRAIDHPSGQGSATSKRVRISQVHLGSVEKELGLDINGLKKTTTLDEVDGPSISRIKGVHAVDM